LLERSTVDEVVSFWEPDLLNRVENQKNHEYAAKYCLDHHLILSLQTHLYAGIA
jgi:7-carboxy-7-deazaguanine synthase